MDSGGLETSTTVHQVVDVIIFNDYVVISTAASKCYPSRHSVLEIFIVEKLLQVHYLWRDA